MNRILILTAIMVSALVPASVYAWAGAYGGPSFPGVDFNPGVAIMATPQTITAGDSTYVTFYSLLASENVTSNPEPDVEANCTTNFAYTAIPYEMMPGFYYGTMGATTDYPTATKTYTVTCRLFQTESASGVTYKYETNSVTVTVNPAPAADLTAGAVTPTTATVGTAVTLSSTVSNSGGTTGAGFTTLFQRATTAAGANATDIGTYTHTSALAGAQTSVATRSYTFPSAATWYVRACADKSSGANNGAITESNESNNCGAWTAVTVTASQCGDGIDNDGDGMIDAADPSCTSCTGSCTESPVQSAPSVSCGVNTQTVTAGGTAIYTATPLNGAGAPYTWTPSVQTNCTGTNTRTCTFPTTGPYTMSVRATGTGNPTATCPVVTAGCTGPAAVAITANGEGDDIRVNDNSAVTVAWTVSGTASQCTVTGTDGYSTSFTPSSCSAANSASRTVTTQTVYTVTCGAAKDSVIVNVETDLDEF